MKQASHEKVLCSKPYEPNQDSLRTVVKFSSSFYKLITVCDSIFIYLDKYVLGPFHIRYKNGSEWTPTSGS